MEKQIVNDTKFSEWIASLSREKIDIWREAMSNLRQLHNDVWNGVRFFLTINGILLAAVVGLLKIGGDQKINTLLILLLSVIGFF